MSTFATLVPSLLQLLGPALQPFLASGGAVGLLCGILLYVQGRKPKQSAEDLASEKWDLRKMQALRQENDELRARLRTLELDRDRGWDAGRAMAVLAHRLWHDLVNVMQTLPVEHRGVTPLPVPALEEIAGLSPYEFPDRYARQQN